MIKDKFQNNQIILASKSPRRKELLERLDLDFITISLETDESYSEELKKHEITEFLCHKKKQAYHNWQENQILITSDTIVWYKNKAFEKPKSREEAIEMLQTLSGQTHEVITSVGIFSTQKELVLSDITQVTFGELDQQEIEYYVDTYQPYDKAGSYGIQEWIGYIGITKIEGSYFNVMGLPVQKLYQALKDF
ncbi:Maf family nucleotide pyrophosphatase [Weeksellaceae bacterium KMM 9724]|uniref:Maf family nucleotide pyrophosphatase n=1 Tax=Profundicola chukchiensis TaxID=2961959 RepID=UPI00243B3ED0|nr:Maf family nucleotide pyrophosphatase [Profundicola chukchiensis]MDG4950482.1 Maf family nucleotide pyrophosphatase [Profundicola chukchiensis]